MSLTIAILSFMALTSSGWLFVTAIATDIVNDPFERHDYHRYRVLRVRMGAGLIGTIFFSLIFGSYLEAACGL